MDKAVSVLVGGAVFCQEHVPRSRSAEIDAWMDLMEAVEALCPRWPDRELVVDRDYRL